jgi:hypothetical protein
MTTVQRKLPYRRVNNSESRTEVAEFRYSKQLPFEVHLTFPGAMVGTVTTWVMSRELLIEGTLQRTADPDAGDVLVRAVDDPQAVEITLRPPGLMTVLLFEWEPFTQALAESCRLVGYGEEAAVFDVDMWLAGEFPGVA